MMDHHELRTLILELSYLFAMVVAIVCVVLIFLL
jgi:hypothetical protein